MNFSQQQLLQARGGACHLAQPSGSLGTRLATSDSIWGRHDGVCESETSSRESSEKYCQQERGEEATGVGMGDLGRWQPAGVRDDCGSVAEGSHSLASQQTAAADPPSIEAIDRGLQAVIWRRWNICDRRQRVQTACFHPRRHLPRCMLAASSSTCTLECRYAHGYFAVGVAGHDRHLRPLPRRHRLLPAATAASDDRSDAGSAATTRRAALSRALAAAATLLATRSVLPQAAAAAVASEAAEAAVAAGRGSVAAVAGIASGQQGSATGLQQLGSGLVWDRQGHIVVPYAPLTRLQRQSTAGNPRVRHSTHVARAASTAPQCPGRRGRALVLAALRVRCLACRAGTGRPPLRRQPGTATRGLAPKAGPCC